MEIPTTNHVEVSNEEILQGYSILKEKFGDKINLLYIKNSKCKTIIEEFENGKITKVTGDYKKDNSNLDYLIKNSKIIPIFFKIGFNKRFHICKIKTIQFFIKKFVPFKNYEEKWLKSLHL